MVEYGIVKFFDGRDGKKYGFMRVLDNDGNVTSEEIFFHYNDGEFVGSDGTDVFFDGSSRTEDGQHTRLEPPNKDDKLVFVRFVGRKGVKANQWGYADAWDERVFAIAADSGEPLDHEGHEDDLEEEDDVSEQEIYNRAYAHHGDAELAREAASIYPGDFM